MMAYTPTLGAMLEIKDDMGLVNVNTTATREHGAEIERGICLLKERSRCVVKSIPFQYLHEQIVIQLVCFVTMFVNAIPTAEGIS